MAWGLLKVRLFLCERFRFFVDWLSVLQPSRLLSARAGNGFVAFKQRNVTYTVRLKRNEMGAAQSLGDGLLFLKPRLGCEHNTTFQRGYLFKGEGNSFLVRKSKLLSRALADLPPP